VITRGQFIISARLFSLHLQWLTLRRRFEARNEMTDKFKTPFDALLNREAGSMDAESRERIDIIRHKLKFTENKPVVACIEKLDPLTIAGSWLPEAIAVAGGIPLLVEPEKDSLQVHRSQISSLDPDIIIIAFRGLTIEAALKEMTGLLQRPDFALLKAVKNKRFYIAAGDRLCAPDPDIVGAVEMLAEMIHPKQFIFGYEGEGWVQFSV
jgi:iron complex transport system substrate-binding protein